MNFLDDRLPQRFWDKVIPEPNSGCWLWTATLSRAARGRREGGYGRLSDGHGRVANAHRFAYLALVGKIAPGLHLDHLCRTRCCVNPAHLEPVTNAENSRRGTAVALIKARAAAQTHCPNGHGYDGTETLMTGGARCRVCRREKDRRSYLKHKKPSRERARLARAGVSP